MGPKEEGSGAKEEGKRARASLLKRQKSTPIKTG